MLNSLENNKVTAIVVTTTDSSLRANKSLDTVYIKSEIINGYKIKFDKNDSSATGTMVEQTINSGDSAKLSVNAFVKNGSTFGGWMTNPTGSTIAYADGAVFKMGTADVTLYAKWSKKQTFALTLNSTNGSVTKSPDATVYDSGAAVTLTPVPATNYHFSGWSGALTGTANPATIIMNSAKSVTAGFEANPPNTFTFIVLSSNGTVKKTPELPQYDSGSSVGLKATATTGYRFVNWSGDATGTTDSTTVIINSGKSVTANFALIPYQLTVAAGTGGTITMPATSPTTVNYGALTPIKTVANTGFTFSNWTVNTGTAAITSSTSDSTTVSLTIGNATVTANFTANPVTLTLTNDGHGSTTPVSPASGSYGVPISISATPSSGYSFSSWTLTTGTATFLNANQASTTVTLTANSTIRANFTANPVTLTLTNDGHGSTTPASPASGSYGVPISISATPSNGYSFSSWTTTTGTATFGNANQTSTTVTLTTNATIRANFAANPVTLTLTNDGHGSTTPTTSASGSHGVPISISATPSSGYNFSSWSITPSTAGSIANTTLASTSVTLTSATATVRANFLPIDYTITYDYDNGSGSNPSTYNISQTPVTLGVASKTGFTFVGWFDNQALTGNKVTSISSGSTGPKSFWAKWVVMDRDGNVYDTVIINGVTWMKTNLITRTLSNGTNIMKEYPSDWSSAQNPQCCYYNFDPNNGRIHGALYNASAAKSSMLAPEGWHVATMEEWKVLVPNTNIASELASIYFWNGVGTNSTGFSATPGGNIGCEGSTANMGDMGYWWTSTMCSKLNFVQFGVVHGMIGYDVTEANDECNGYSIRCVLNH